MHAWRAGCGFVLVMFFFDGHMIDYDELTNVTR
jgi:hypothetical protein